MSPAAAVEQGQKGYHVVLAYLEQLGLDTLFTLSSGSIMHMLSEVEGPGRVRVVHARHEQSAVSMADGYARTSGQIGVCTVGHGPAVAQTGTALTSARKNGSNLLLLVPDSAISLASSASSYERYDLKGFALESFLESTIGTVFSANSHDTLVPSLKESVRQLRIGNGPVALRVPVDVLNSTLDHPVTIEEGDIVPAGPYGLETAAVTPDGGAIQAAIDCYLDSDATKIPVILAGEGVIRSSAEDEVVSLAERINAVIVTTARARGLFDDHPYSMGFVGLVGHNLANQYINESGFVLAVGCSLNMYTMDSSHALGEGTKLVHVDRDPDAIERYTAADVGVVGDARTALQRFIEGLEREGIHRGETFWDESLRREIESELTWGGGDYEEQSDRIDPRDLIRRLDELLPDDRLVITDGGQQQNWVIDGITVDHPSESIWTNHDFHSDGLGLPTGIGVALSGVEKTPVAFCGDVGVMMSVQELDTAARYDVPILVFILNDGLLGAEYHRVKKQGFYADGLAIEAPDFAAVAASFGAEGHTVRSIDDLERLKGAVSSKPSGPVVFDCLINDSVIHRAFW